VDRLLSAWRLYSKRGWGLAFTRYCFTSKLYCGSPSSVYCPPPHAKPTLLQYYCTTTAQHTPPTDPPALYAKHQTILVMAISCKGKGQGWGAG